MAQNIAEIPAQVNDDIAVVGYSFRLPQDVNDDLSFWDVLETRRNLMTSWPESRMNAESFLDTKPDKVRMAHISRGFVASS